MKKFFVMIMVTLFIVTMLDSESKADDKVLFGVASSSGVNTIKLPEDLCELVGKVISFTDENYTQKNVWNFFIIGTSEHIMSMYKGVIFHVGAVNYLGYQVKQISYNTNSNGDVWLIEYYAPAGYLERESRHEGHVREKSEQIKVISIK